VVRRPGYGVAVLIVVQPFAYYRDIAETTITLPKAALIAVSLGLLYRHASFHTLHASGPRRLLIAIGLVIATTAFSIFHAMHAGAAFRETLKWLEYLLLFAIAYVAFREDPDVNLASRTIVITVSVVALIALSQEILGAPSGLWFNGHPIPRIAGPLEGPNQLAGYLDVALPVLLALALFKFDLWLAGALALAAFADVATLSRAGILCAAAGLLLVGLTLSRSQYMRKAVLAVLGGAAAGGFTAAFWGWTVHANGILRGFEVNYAGGVGTRSQLWHAAFTLWKKHPVFGLGAGNFELDIGQTGVRNIRTHTNSLYIQALVEQGVVGLFTTVCLVYQSIATFWTSRSPRDPLVVGALGAGVALGLHQTVDLLIFFPKVAGMWWIVMALACAQLARRSA
ncbi:MAG: O-antigen ligase family protein, partial [Candidatus Eremiobacteraeota bacterium]|nr:O-antigen ligase family protein [Candidatus Eremiobacteraeota bacterium]